MQTVPVPRATHGLAYYWLVHTPLHLIGKIYIYFVLAIGQFRAKDGFLRSAALAYSLLFAIIPLIASMSLFVSKLYELNKTRIHLFLNQKEINAVILKFLPYTTEKLDMYINSFVHNAMTIGWIGTGVLVITLIFLVASLENIFNITWNVTDPRPVIRKLGVILYIIFLFSVTFSLSLKLGSTIVQKHMLIRIPGKLLSFFLVAVAFSILYHKLPRVNVKWRSALLGGFLAAGFYEIGKVCFKWYILVTFNYSKIYGSLSVVPVFIISLFMLSLIIILGAEMSYTTQHFSTLYHAHLERRSQRKQRRQP